ncbi:WD40 domain-binding protein [Encephalitozoon intestinalis ATCC 50506]|uniref:WD40 domain-binding protein n=1 Tax=Encephalitozoon intestinalis (strain ATCC 50506) TaxID=876142 RepID=E0S964_ENCIT|nr:WD40 domain-binding protein [Encephalitozoon intestinalis ATCC 50506]ADM12307.1 WD40 domain-binding protein [Encephalitozoon intestinalis ATCC 50506]UTX46119.1 hypothetical protein GPK93_09g17070 [Encephalitozoon intestinalis]
MALSIEIPNAYLEFMSICDEYEIVSLVGKRTSVIISYADDLRMVQRVLDEHPDENFQCSEFLIRQNDVLLALGGSLGIIKVLNLSKGTFVGYIQAHGGIIFSIKRYKDEYLLSCSEDTTIKMWDVSELKCVCVFGGYTGHRDHVLSIDVSDDLRYLASGGTDCSIRVWRIPSSLNKFQCVAPIYLSPRIHKFPIQCVRFYREFLVFYSGESRIDIISPRYGEVEPTSRTEFVGGVKFEGQLLRGFEIDDGMLVAVTESQDIILFKMNDIGFTSQSTILRSTKKGKIRDFRVIRNRMFILFEDSFFRVLSLA